MLSGVDEGYTIKQHTLMAMGQFATHFAHKSSLTPQEIKLLWIGLGLHDIGKALAPTGNKEMETLRTAELINRIAPQLPLTRQELNILLALVKEDPIGQYFKDGV